MKVVEKIEIEYVVPENQAEYDDIEKLIKNFEKNKNNKLKFSDLKIIDNSNKLQIGGYWRKK